MAARPASASQRKVPTPPQQNRPLASRPLSAGTYRAPSRPQSGQSTPACQRPGSAPSARGISSGSQEHAAYPELDAVGGMAGALLASAKNIDPRLPPEMRLCQAALMRLAPCGRLLPCKANYCCWRWAANKLLDEAALSRAEASALRIAFDEELGDSAKQALLNLQDEHTVVVDKLRATRRDMEALERTAQAAEERYKESEEARAELVEAYERAVRAREHAETLSARAIDDFSALEEELAEQKELAGQSLALQEQCRKAEARAKDVRQQVVNETAHLSSEIEDLRRERAEMKQKLRMLEAQEYSALKRHKAARRAKHGKR